MNLEKYKQVISDAINEEIKAKQFYEKASKLIKEPVLKELFETFAGEEAKHEKILTDILNLEKMNTSFFDFDKDFKVSETIEMPVVNKDMDLQAAIGIAMKNEETAMKKYTALAENCEEEQLKAVFLDLAAMEREHKFKIEQNFVNVAYPEVW